MSSPIPQLAIVFLGLGAMHLAASKKHYVRVWAGTLGLCAQPFWLWSAIEAGQWGIALLVPAYAWAWVRMIRNNRRST